jgi:indole-3-glycerol phosphate synthase
VEEEQDNRMLAEILEHKRREIAGLKEDEWRLRAEDSARPRGFLPLATNRTTRAQINPLLIAEIKRASPSRGALAEDLDPVRQARVYAENGAAAISVLTDEKYFRGSIRALIDIRRENPAAPGGQPVPILRKDFILTPAQIHQSRAIGADAVLLIVAALTDGELPDLHALALSIHLTPLVEVHTEAELECALRIPGLSWVGVNNRDLATFEIRLDTSLALCPKIPPGIGAVAESGIFTAADVSKIAAAGADAVLVGEALVTAPDPAAKVRELAGLS